MRRAKGQIKPKADLHTIHSPKKRTNERICLFFAVKSKKAKKKKCLFVRFLGESTTLQSVYGLI
jgi:hypothetical protein